MCGIAGIFRMGDGPAVERENLVGMIQPVAHRGPDGFGFFHSPEAGLAHARLSIIDLEGGWQPISNEDETLWIVFNGEIFNYIELREGLEAGGHRFRTCSDTEVILHLYEDLGEKCLSELNGQFAIAILDTRRGNLFLARDRVGVRPLFYSVHGKNLYFGSEMKSVFAADPGIPREIDLRVLDEIFTFWMPAGGDTIFRGVRQLEPGCWVRADRRGLGEPREYWSPPFHAVLEREEKGSVDDYAERLRELLIDAVRLRLRADVPVGAYLSGGLDSSSITAVVRNFTSNPLKTFSVTFGDGVYDESGKQRDVVSHLGTEHHVVHCDYRRIADNFPDIIWHTEVPILRTAPGPLFSLSELVRETGYKVVLTGEGADEILAGYDLFKEAKIRAFIGRSPGSGLRPQLLRRLYPYLALSPTRSAEYARRFFDTDCPLSDPFYSHRPRWRTTSGAKIFFSDVVKAAVEGMDPVGSLTRRHEKNLEGLDLLSRAQYLETRTLLPNYLLSSQGDRMAMAHSVEGRYPFLDHRVVEFACSIPPSRRMPALREKDVLKRAMEGLLPPSVLARKKQPYMAPDIPSFFGGGEPDYLGHYLSDSLLREAGIFNPDAVSRLVAKCRKGDRQGFRENMAFVGILSTQILYDRFVREFRVDPPRLPPPVRVFSQGFSQGISHGFSRGDGVTVPGAVLEKQ